MQNLKRSGPASARACYVEESGKCQDRDVLHIKSQRDTFAIKLEVGHSFTQILEEAITNLLQAMEHDAIKQDLKFWRDRISNYTPYVSVVAGKPSQKLSCERFKLQLVSCLSPILQTVNEPIAFSCARVGVMRSGYIFLQLQLSRKLQKIYRDVVKTVQEIGVESPPVCVQDSYKPYLIIGKVSSSVITSDYHNDRFYVHDYAKLMRIESLIQGVLVHLNQKNEAMLLEKSIVSYASSIDELLFSSVWAEGIKKDPSSPHPAPLPSAFASFPSTFVLKPFSHAPSTS